MNKKQISEEAIEVLFDYEQIKNRLFIKALPIAHVWIDRLPHVQVGDIARCYALDMNGVAEFGEGEIVTVNNDLAKKWGIDIQQLDKDAFQYSKINRPFSLKTMEETMSEMFGIFLPEDEQAPMWVLRSGEFYGAGAVFYPYALEAAAEKLGGDFYILPSSIHEVILVSCDNNQEELAEIVKSVNSTEVEENERLSNNVFRYEKERKILMMV